MEAADCYIELLKRTLLNFPYNRHEPGFNLERRTEGQDWPAFAHTMIGMKRLTNLEECVRKVLKDRIPGDLIETGVWRGGAVILMRGILKAFGVTNRTVWVADSFEGLPAPSHPMDAGDAHHVEGHLRVPMQFVESNFDAYNLLDEQVKFLPGWFKDTLPGAPIKQLAILRLDGDMYESTMTALECLYPRLSPGGFCIVDDYQLSGARAAVHRYRTEHAILEEVELIDRYGAFWRKAGL